MAIPPAVWRSASDDFRIQNHVFQRADLGLADCFLSRPHILPHTNGYLKTMSQQKQISKEEILKHFAKRKSKIGTGLLLTLSIQLTTAGEVYARMQATSASAELSGAQRKEWESRIAQIAAFLWGGTTTSIREAVDETLGVDLSSKFFLRRMYKSKHVVLGFLRPAVAAIVQETGGKDVWRQSTEIERAGIFRALFNQAPDVICEVVWNEEKTAIDFDLIWSLAGERSQFWQCFCRDRLVGLSELVWNEFGWQVNIDDDRFLSAGAMRSRDVDGGVMICPTKVPLKTDETLACLGLARTSRITAVKSKDARGYGSEDDEGGGTERTLELGSEEQPTMEPDGEGGGPESNDELIAVGVHGLGNDTAPVDAFCFDKDGFDKDGFDKDGFNKAGLDQEGYDECGFDAYGDDRYGSHQFA